MQREDVPYDTSGLSSKLQYHWSRHSIGKPSSIFHPDRLLRLRTEAIQNPDVDQDALAALSYSIIQDDIKKDLIVEKQKSEAVKERSRKSSAAPKKMATPKKKAKTPARAPRIGSSPLFDAKICHSASSKINWIVNEVRLNCQNI